LRDGETVRLALNACARRLDGKAAAATVVQRKRAVLYNALGFAVERGLLEFNPVDRIQWKAPAVAEQVCRRVVANTAQVEQVLAACPDVDRSGAQLVAFFACMYFGGLRPSEASSLRAADCQLPVRGWDATALVSTAPHAGADWTDDGKTRYARGLAPSTQRHAPSSDPAGTRSAC
jgi:integrase